MRARLIVGLLAAALGVSACSSAIEAEPLPSSTAGGMITEITNPEAPFEVAWTTAVGDDGSAFVTFIDPDSDPVAGVPPAGLALVYRDGTYDTIVELGDERFAGEWPMWGGVSDTTVVWTAQVGENGTAVHFWDRESNQVTDGATVLTEGDLEGMEVDPSYTRPILVGDVFLWTQFAYEEEEPQRDSVIVATTGDGRAWIPIEDDRSWTWFGKNECASTTGRPVLGAVERITDPKTDPEGEASSLVSWQLDASDPYELNVIEGSDIVLDPWRDDLRILFSIRCEDDFLSLSRDEALDDENGWPPFAILTPGDSPSIEYLDANGQSGSLVGSAFTPQWILVSGDTLNWYPRVIIDRMSGATATLPVDHYLCTNIGIHGDYVSWQVPTRDSHPAQMPLIAGCDTLIGVLTEPTG